LGFGKLKFARIKGVQEKKIKKEKFDLKSTTIRHQIKNYDPRKEKMEQD
jgi:hypothetical protein